MGKPGDGALQVLRTRTELDIEGNALRVIDARGNIAESRTYAMGGLVLEVESEDGGWQRSLVDVAGAPLRSWNARGFASRVVVDALRRGTHAFVTPPGGVEMLVTRTVWGEEVATAVADNLRGRVFRVYDGAGEHTNVRHDFAGNLLQQSVRLNVAFEGTQDWSGLGGASDPDAIAAIADASLEPTSFVATMQYDALGRLVSRTTPDGSETRTRFNEAGLLEAVDVRVRGAAEPSAIVTAVDYDARGQRLRCVHGNGTTASYAYEPDTFRLSRMRLVRAIDDAVLQDLRYTYDPVGNIVEIRDGAQQRVFFDNDVVSADQRFEYDALYRLSSASGRELRSLTQPVDADLAFSPQRHADDPAALRRYEETYAWDAVGNIVELRHVASGGNFTRRYAYAPGGNRLLRNSAPGEAAEPFSHSYSYDEHGNMTSMPHLAAMAWDHADRLQHCDLGGGGEVWFVYDASGARVRKVQRNASGSRVRERVYLGEFELYRERAANDVAPEMERQTLHVGDGARRLCLVETLTVDDGEPVAAPVSVPRFQHGNHLDSASLELDGDAAVFSYEEFHPFGTTSYAANDGAVEVSAKRYRYIGKERDEETGLYHLGARYYTSWLGRWTAADPTGLADGVNRYAYCRGSPITLRDTSGSAAETPGLVVERALLQARHTAIEAQLLALDARDAAATASRRQFSEAMARQRIEVGGLQAAVQLQRRYTASRGWLDTVTRMPTLTELGDAIAEDIALRPFAYAPGIGPAIAATHHTHDAGDAWSRRQYLEASGHVAGALGEAALAYLDIAAPAAGVAEHGAERVITLFSNGKKVVRSAAVRTAEGNAPREAERVAAEGEAFRLARHGDHPSPRPGGAQSHHGVMSAWMKKHHPAYNPDEAPAILMPAEAHARTFGVYNRWRAEMKAEMGGVFDWAKVSEDQMRRLSEKMFDAAGVPRQVRADYWRWFERMKGALHRGR